MHLQEIQIFNRAPFENIKLTLDESNVIVLSGVNGAGKTTILSYIVDAFFELAKQAFPLQFESVENKFYRISSDVSVLDKSKHSFVYIRFMEEGNYLDYIDICGLNNENEYNRDVEIQNPITFNVLKNKIGKEHVIKYFTETDKSKIQKFFNANLMTYFPAYRYEQPSYLNDPYEISLSFRKESGYTGYLLNPIEATTNLPNIANWIMDIVLDSELYKTGTYGAQKNLEHLNKIFSELLYPKVKKSVRLGIGPRQLGLTRIQIVEKKGGKRLYPSIFNMSSGELAMVSLFGEITRQADNIGHAFDNVTGIVLIDEIDKHLHIKLQKEILPSVMKLFPNIQFIVTSHSPFFNLGLEQKSDINYRIFDLDNNGLTCTPCNNELFEEVYNMMLGENERFAQKYNSLLAETEKTQRPLLITEGKTDWKHIKASMKSLGVDLPIDIYEYDHTMGDVELMNLLDAFMKSKPNRKLIGMFDRDNEKTCKDFVGKNYVELYPNIYAFSIPLVNEDVYGQYTSIEHYYSKKDLARMTSDGRRLFLGDEFYASGVGKDLRHQTRISGIQNKVLKNGVIDEKVYVVADDPEFEHSVALSKDDFAQLILDQDEFAEGFDFSNFVKIFDVINDICGIEEPVET